MFSFFQKNSQDTWQVLVEYNEKKKKKKTCSILKNVMHAYVGIMFFKEASVFVFFQKAHWPIIIPMIDVRHVFDKKIFIEKMRLSNFKFIFSEFQRMRNNYAKCTFFVYL